MQEKNTKWLAAIAGFLYPFGGLVYSLRNYYKSSAKVLFFVFCLFMGYNVMIYRTIDVGAGGVRDAVKLAERFVYANQYQISWEESISLFGAIDFFTGTIAYLLTRITNDPVWLFFALSIFMGVFVVKNLWYILDKLPVKLDLASILLLSLLLFVSPIWKIDAGRWYIALQVFIWGLLPYIYENKKTQLIWSYGSILIHFSFFIPMVLLTIYLITPKNSITPFFLFFIVLAFIREIDLVLVRQVLELIMPDYMMVKIGYVSDEYVHSRLLRHYESSFFLRYYSDAFRWLVVLLSSVIYVNVMRNRIELSKSLKKAFSIALYFSGLSFLFSQIPIGARYLLIGYTLLLTFVLILMNHRNEPAIQKVVYLSSPIIVFIMIVNIRLALNYFNLVSIFGNFILAALVRLNTPLSEYVLNLL